MGDFAESYILTMNDINGLNEKEISLQKRYQLDSTSSGEEDEPYNYDVVHNDTGNGDYSNINREIHSNANLDMNELIIILNIIINNLQIPGDYPKIKRKADQLENKVNCLLLQALSVRSYFSRRLKGIKKIEASEGAAQEVYKKDKLHSFKSKSIRAWADYFELHHCFKKFEKGTHTKTKTIINDVNIQQVFKDNLSDWAENDVTPTRFMNLLNDSLLAQCPGAPDRISKETARRWLGTLGYRINDQGKRHYVYDPNHGNINENNGV